LGQKVIVLCHLAFCPGSCPNACLLWNYMAMLQVGTMKGEGGERAGEGEVVERRQRRG
jgi:hypothetical protein